MAKTLKHAPISLWQDEQFEIYSENFFSLFNDNGGHHVDIPQCVACQKNVVYAFIKLSAKSHSFNILRTMVVLICTTNT